MKIKSLEIKDYPPIKNLSLKDLGDIVIIAGANGSGKTRLKDAIVQTLQNGSHMTLEIISTRKEEEEAFGAESITTIQGQQNQNLIQYIHNRRFGGRARYVGSLVQIDSQRNIETIKYNPINYVVSDPDDQETQANWGYQPFSNRWQDFMNYIHQKVASYKNKLAEEVESDPTKTGLEILQKLPRPLDKYKDLFTQLLPGKVLQDINPASPSQFQYTDENGNLLPFSSLSSGEQEVVKVIFDIARKDIKHSVIIVDEPELHLHPTLTLKLIETLKSVGDHTNQFIFLTHSADLISTYYSTGNVYFIDSSQSGANQAHKLSDLNRSHKAVVNVIGEHLGLFAVGKKIAFVEGENSSIDRLTYHKIAQKYCPELKLVPAGSVKSITLLNELNDQIQSSIFGIDLFMIRDRDGLSETQITKLEENSRIWCLKRRHIENYFLDPEILFKVAQKLYTTSVNQDLNEAYIEQKLKEIAETQITLNLLQNTKEYIGLNFNLEVPTVKSAQTKSVEEITAELTKNATESVEKLSQELSEETLKQWMNAELERLKKAIKNNEWKSTFQGKQIFSSFCSSVLSENILKVREAYVDIALNDKPEVFDDIIDIFKKFN